MTETKTETKIRPRTRQAACDVFKLFVMDGLDWVTVRPGDNPRDAFRAFHKRKPSRDALLFVVHPSYVTDGIGGYTQAQGAFAPVLVGKLGS